MSKASDTFENEFLKLLFQNISIANIGDASGLQPAATAGNLYLRLCTDASVVDDANIGTECAYTGYVAGGVAVERSSGGWAVSGNEISNVAEIVFGACTAGSENVRYVEIWRNNTGTTEPDRIAWAQLSSDVTVSAGITPKFNAEALSITFD